MGRATATVTTVTGQTRWKSSPIITATASGQSAQVTVKVPDLSMVGLGIMLLALNLLRVVHIFVIGVTRPDLFGLVHGFVWEAAIVAAVIGIWWSWMPTSQSSVGRASQ